MHRELLGTDPTPGQIAECQGYYFVIDTKSTGNLDDRRALTDSERWKIKCAMNHFDAIEIEARLGYRPYIAPVKD